MTGQVALWFAHCWQEAIIEGIGTFILVFTSTSAVRLNQISDGITHLGISFVFGAVFIPTYLLSSLATNYEDTLALSNDCRFGKGSAKDTHC